MQKLKCNSLITNRYSLKRAFTLAEVLITLGIIGVVAVLTIPALVQNYQTKSWNTAASNFEAKFGSALMVMNTQNNLANLNTTENFVSELQKHIKITKVCDNSHLNECFPDVDVSYTCLDVIAKGQVSYQGKPKLANDLTNSEALGQTDWKTNTIGVQFVDGVSAILAYNPKCSANPYDNNSVTLAGTKDSVSFVTDCVAVVYDTSGFSSPNIKGKDIRLSAKADFGDGDCLFKIGSRCVTKVVQPTFLTWNACNADGTSSDPEDLKRISNLGIQYCSGKNDYWAGVVEACGGVSKVASMSDLEKVARYVYNDDSISGSIRQSGFTLDTAKVAEVGLRGSNFYVWSNQETRGSQGAIDFAFAGSGMVGSDWYGRGTKLQGVCIGD